MSATATESGPFDSAGRRNGGRGGSGQSSRGARRGAGGHRKNNANASRLPPAPTSTAASGEHPNDEVSLAVGAASLTIGAANADDEAVGATSTEGDICWLCAEPVKYYSVSECNHRTCHVCAVRLRALYKKMECTFCKVSKLIVQLFDPVFDTVGTRYSLFVYPHNRIRSPKSSSLNLLLDRGKNTR
jgi:hypothetical protein